MVALNAAKVGVPQEVKWIVCDDEGMEGLREIGIEEGAKLTVISSFYGNVIVALKNIKYAIGTDLAYCIKVG